MNWINFIGRFHPLLVHLPIGILLMASLFDWLSYYENFKKLKRSVRLMLLIGTITSLASCITGYLLSQTGEYNATTVSQHQWLGIVTLVLSFFYWRIKKEKTSELGSKGLAVVMIIFISATGHLGGTLTHGENYLTEDLNTSSREINFTSLDLAKAMYYKDIVEPILNARCYSCHGEAKQKGKLRLDLAEYILKGGKDGKVLVAFHSDESEMINRMLLPLNEKNHMPPKEKPQPSSAEIELLKKWIDLGASFDKSIVALNAVESVQKMVATKNQKEEELNQAVSPADENILDQLKKLNVTIQPIAAENNHLSANLVNVQSADSVIILLPRLKDQLVWLTVHNSKFTDEHLKAINELTELRKLDISHSSISGKGLASVKNLIHLHQLNLSFTEADRTGAAFVSQLPELNEIFLFNTKVTPSEMNELKKQFPKIRYDIGGYVVPIFASDTTLVKPPKEK
jgi:uncharacterized membrane protein